MKKLFYFLLALPLLFVACSEKGDEPKEEPQSKEKLELTSAETMEFECVGGQGEITFLYEGNNLNTNGPSTPTTGKTLSIECEADWISVAAEVDVLASAIRFEVAYNETFEPREATIKASIKELYFEVLVKQAANNEINGKEEYVEGWAINGTMNDWAKEQATPMTEEGNYFVVKGLELSTEDNFNFIFDGGVKSYGGNGQAAEPNYIYEAESWGSNIHVSEACRYDIYLSTDLTTYRIMAEGTNPDEAQEALKPGEKQWSIYGAFEGNNRQEDVVLQKSGAYLMAKGIKFVDDMSFVVRCNRGDEGTLGVALAEAYATEEAIKLEAKSEENYEIKVAAEAGQRYDIFFTYDDTKYEVWVMPEGRYPIIWDRVEGAYMPAYNNFLLYLITNDIVLTLDFKAGSESVVNYVIPAGTYTLGNTDGTWCFDQQYCIAKVRGHEIPLLDGYMTIEHKDGKYDIFVDMRTATLDVLKMHYVGEIG
ncbi:MAG: BACON domain-containing protein, partial [Alistipes sp.]|nr:BACON domain-containing protein [Alistipes sp.]